MIQKMLLLIIFTSQTATGWVGRCPECHQELRRQGFSLPSFKGVKMVKIVIMIKTGIANTFYNMPSREFSPSCNPEVPLPPWLGQQHCAKILMETKICIKIKRKILWREIKTTCNKQQHPQWEWRSQWWGSAGKAPDHQKKTQIS